MKILYISPENTVGTLSLWKKEHISNNHICRTVTFFRSPKGFKDDVCLELQFNFNRQQLAMSLSQLVETDYTLLNDIIIEYCMMIDDNKLDALEQHVNKNMNELI